MEKELENDTPKEVSRIISRFWNAVSKIIDDEKDHETSGILTVAVEEFANNILYTQAEFWYKMGTEKGKEAFISKQKKVLGVLDRILQDGNAALFTAEDILKIERDKNV